MRLLIATMNVWSLLDRAVRLFGEATATIDETGRSWTYRELEQRALGLASTVVDRGISPKDHVAILAHNGPEYVAAYFGAAAAGAVLLPLNTRLHDNEIADLLDHCGARLALVGNRFGERSLPVTTVDLHEACEPVAIFAPRLQGADDTAHLYYTSGTTGEAKGVMLTHANVTTHALAAIAELHLTDRDAWAHIAPMFHLADAWATFAITWVGGTHRTLADFTPAAALDCLEPCTITNLVPTMLQRMLVEPDAADRPWRLRTLLSGGAPIAPETVRGIHEVFEGDTNPGFAYVQTYGMTETSPYLTLSTLTAGMRRLPRDEQLRRASRTGRPFLTVKLRVVGADGVPVPADDASVGEIQVKGPTVTPGYYRNGAATAAAFTADGYLRTGDLAVVDEQGFVNIVDRSKDVILTGGETVYSIEVENALYEHPDVIETAVYGQPDPEWGERVVAAVVMRAGANLDEARIATHCRDRLAGFKCPKSVVFLNALPRTGSGKISKRRLREGKLS